MGLRPKHLPVALGCFALPAGLFLLLCALMGFAPFGSGSILIFDLSDQFVEFLCALKHGDLFFSWSTALGGSYIGTFSYYVSSPFSLLTLLCPNEHMPVAVVFLVALKLGCAGVTFSLLLRRRTGRYDGAVLAFSLAYALMSYAVVYAMSFMWLDGLIWLPVLLMGCHAVAEEKRPVWLSLALAVSFVSSWYISYMLGLFCVLYLLWLCLCEGKRLAACAAALLRLALCALPALLVSAWLWLPTALAMFGGKLTNNAAPFVWGFNWPVSTLFDKLFVPGAYDSVTYTGSAWLYCSVPAALLAVVWFFQKRPARVRVVTGLFAAGLALCLWFAPLDRVWHLFQPPNSFPGRWSFVVSCFVLLLGFDALHRLLCAHPLPRLLPALLALTVAVDMTGNGLALLHQLDGELGFESYASYYDYKTDMQPLVDEIRAADGFVRAVSDVQRSRNEPAAFGYKGLTFFSSSYDAAVNRMLGGLGLAQDWFWSTGLGSTPVTDLLFSVGWRISDKPLPHWYEPVAESGDFTLYRTPVTPSPAYFADLSRPVNGRDCFAYQSQLLAAVSGVDGPFFHTLDPQQLDEPKATTWTVTTNGQPLYGSFPRVAGHAGLLYVNGQFHGPIYTTETDCVLYLGTFSPDTPVDITLITTAPAALRTALLCELDTQALDRAAAALSGNTMSATGHGTGWLEGSLTAPADGWVYTSIPAQKGWTVRVDGQEVRPVTYDGALLSLPVSAGTHNLTFTYTAPGLVPGLGLTGLGLAWLAAELLRRRKR